MLTYIEEYYQFLLKNPDKAAKKVLEVYKKLVYDIYHPKEVIFYNEATEKEEKHVYVFNAEKANRPITFIEKYCKHSKGKWARKPIVLELWQKAFIQAVFGFVDKETLYRKYTKVALFIGRKNGKSTLAAAIGLYMLCADGEGGAECYSVAVKKEQAKIVWDEAKKMINKSPVLHKKIRTLINGIFYDKKEAVFKALASQDNSLDGLNASFVSADEIHAWTVQNLLNVLYDSMAVREQPLLLETSTAGFIRENVYDNEYDYFEDVIKGYQGLEGGIIDESVLPVIYELDSRAEWQDEKKWFKANPGLGTIKSYKFIRNKITTAKNSPKDLGNLLCKDFNVPQTSEEKWLSFETAINTKTFDINIVKDTYAIGGVDLSSTSDLTCATILIFKNGFKYVIQKYFIPRANLDLKIKEDRIPYDIWEKRGYVTVCDGASVDYSKVTEWFIEMKEKYEIATLWIGYDPWHATYWNEEMKEIGFELIEVRQGAKTMSDPMKKMESDLIDKRVIYNNNPVLKWCLTNTVVKRDENDNIRPIKGRKQRARIDGTVSLINAYVILLLKLNDYVNIQGD